ncbi:hypothetical protein ABEF92_005039 [Exophiala dermatitidis]|uniref:GAT domain-containing protein n=1 Tax=Exophiala dermatitidis (strain ATCC 34100 / CBS 525.76 / NIH/UT8656) TaxID=858893 RepID=H6C8L2_EXODN|nr:uncharacterized protein HMPREF1120_08401 [Exophiala dermatitidis NIH/UT8656]EHY60439.1 hypothetical protein HMPREF1120_08401 [Exophiala dermatitidis NIH/UT8656]KAJ4524590.1 hypothetical protein HRR75_000180 [Exophiala dermatitidis]KAJ4549900.1 hypothetical protein HRR78_004711 [Exophiala dermatitidis]
MKKFLGNIKKKSGSPERNGSAPVVLPQGDAPEAVVVREVTAFCESGAPNSAAAGDEYLHLPAIVDAAESSPTAAREAAATIRRYLSKDHYQRGFAQYNAVMLLRILTDNPGQAFTQNFDAKFLSTIKELLREGKDGSVQQILRETLDYFEVEKAPGNDTLGPLVEMWRKEKGKRNTLRQTVGSTAVKALFQDHQTEQLQQHRVPPPFMGQQHQSSRRTDVLPPPEELASRIEEAKTTARLLVQTVQSTPQSELLANDLVQEFAGRAQSAQRSIQAYMNCQNPAPDPDTMLTLIETNDQLNIAMSKHQRSVLQARKAQGTATPSPGPQTESMPNPLSMPQHTLGQNVYASGGQGGPQAYSISAHQGQNATPPSVNPQRDEEQYAPPPGPPPAARGAVRNQEATNSHSHSGLFSATETAPPLPTRARPQSQAAAYGVGDNPFADDAYGPDSPQHNKSNTSYNLVDIDDTPSPKRQDSFPLRHDTENSREQHQVNPYGTTSGYMHRQDSPPAHGAIHGTGADDILAHQDQPSNERATDFMSPVDDTGRRMNDMHI